MTLKLFKSDFKKFLCKLAQKYKKQGHYNHICISNSRRIPMYHSVYGLRISANDPNFLMIGKTNFFVIEMIKCASFEILNFHYIIKIHRSK